MFELNWAELLIIGFLALIVIGPEDLPDMFRQLGRFTAKLRQMSREFSRAMEETAKQSGMKDAADDLKAATSSKSLGLDAVREAANKFEKWDPIKNAAKPSSPMPARSLVPPPMPATPVTPVAGDAVAGDALIVDDVGEAEDDLALHAFDGHEAEAASSAPVVHGPATQALYDKQALRSQVLQEQTEKLKAIEAGTYAPVSAAPVSIAPVSAAPVSIAPVSIPPASFAPAVPPDLAALGMTRPSDGQGAVAAIASEVTGPAPRKRSASAKVAAEASDQVASEITGPAPGKRAAKAKVAVAARDTAPALEPRTKTSRKTASKADKT